MMFAVNSCSDPQCSSHNRRVCRREDRIAVKRRGPCFGAEDIEILEAKNGSNVRHLASVVASSSWDLPITAHRARVALGGVRRNWRFEAQAEERGQCKEEAILRTTQWTPSDWRETTFPVHAPMALLTRSCLS
jgi:hypothetical protein